VTGVLQLTFSPTFVQAR